jgi:hypothetical protein
MGGGRGKMTQTMYAHVNKRKKKGGGAGGVAQGIDSEFKPQYHQKKIKERESQSTKHYLSQRCPLSLSEPH